MGTKKDSKHDCERSSFGVPWYEIKQERKKLLFKLQFGNKNESAEYNKSVQSQPNYNRAFQESIFLEL